MYLPSLKCNSHTDLTESKTPGRNTKCPQIVMRKVHDPNDDNDILKLISTWTALPNKNAWILIIVKKCQINRLIFGRMPLKCTKI